MKDANREVLDHGSLPQLLLQRARHTSDRRLVIDAALGLTVSAALAVFRPPFWVPLAALALCLGTYGLWGILDRELSDGDPSTKRAKILRVARSVAALVGVVAAILGGVTVFFGLLGTWIS